jgi:ATP-dependent DNA helicase RecQ
LRLPVPPGRDTDDPFKHDSLPDIARSEAEESEQPIILSPDEERVYQELKRWRNERAMQEGIPAYMVAHNESLKQIVKLGVRTKDDLLKVRGFRHRRIQKYGDEILRIVNGEGRNDPDYFDF